MKSITRRTIGKFWGFTKPDWKFFVAGTSFAAISIIVQDIIPPFIVSLAFNNIQELARTNQPLVLEDFTKYIIFYGLFIGSAIVLWRIQVVFVWVYELRSIKRIMARLFDHLQTQDSTFHANRFGGALVSQANKFVGAYERIMDEFTWSITTGITAFVASLAILFSVAPVYAACLTLVSFAFMWVMSRRMKEQFPRDRELARSESERTAKLADMITNVSTVRAFAGENYENKLFKKQINKTHNAYMGLLRLHLINDAIGHTGTAFISFLAFAVGLVAVTRFNAPAGTLFLAVTYTMGLSRRLWEFSRVMRNLNRAFGDASDMTEILEIEPVVKDPAKPLPSLISRGHVTFDGVTFAYPENSQKPLFKQLNVSIKPGEKVGLVGHSGGGKTTLTQLLLRFMDIQSGEILIDGQNIAQLKQSDVRANIAYVSQEPMLFHRSLRENIAYGNLEADQKTVEAVAKMAHAHDFIGKLPDKYDTLVGERGVKLSGGQRQRIAIARAMLKNAPILVLDEATSALDSESEKLIQDALWKLMEGRTALVIAHRLSTIQKMDRILVMEEGKIIEQGTHKELIRQKGTYAELWSHQSGGFIEE